MRKLSGTEQIYQYCVIHYGNELFTTTEIYRNKCLFDVKPSSISGILNNLKKQGRLQTIEASSYIRGSKKQKKWQVV